MLAHSPQTNLCMKVIYKLIWIYLVQRANVGTVGSVGVWAKFYFGMGRSFLSVAQILFGMAQLFIGVGQFAF